jgi:hypothetical protein
MVSCTVVRELLTEHALGTAGTRESLIVERHLAWCAACRKEAQDLARASATFAFAAATTTPPDGLDDAVVEAVHRVAGRPPARDRRTARRAGTLVVAAAIALSGLGVGAVIATRSTPAQQTDASADRENDALQEFSRLIDDARFMNPEADVFLGVLGPETTGRARGTAMTIVVPRLKDRAVVMVTGLPEREARLPYRIMIADGKGTIIELGTVTVLDPGGEATAIASVSRDLTPFVNVFVKDARDRVVLRGTLRERTSVPSPAP